MIAGGILALFAQLSGLAISAPPALGGGSGVLRFAVIISSHRGHDQAPLRYPARDAARIAAVLREVGGFGARDIQILDDPDVATVRGALRRADDAAAKAPGALLFVYYSGHADASGLLLGEERFAYDELRDRIEHGQAAVRIALLDACHAGAVVRRKGGSRSGGYALGVVDASRARGAAIITASTESETAQESSEIEGSYFTHHVISALRGAGDLDGDGRVTLAEVYGYAYRRTVASTASTFGGSQHPSYDYGLGGTGDVVLTVLAPVAAVSIPPGKEGVYVFLDKRDAVVAEALPDDGRRVRIALPPGRYDVVFRAGNRVEQATVAVPAQGDVALQASSFHPASPTVAFAKGEAELPNALFLGVSLFGPLLANAGSTPVVSVGYRRIRGRWIGAVRGGYGASDVDDRGFRYRFQQLRADGSIGRRIALRFIDLHLGIGAGVAHLSQAATEGPSFDGWAASTFLDAGLEALVHERLLLRMAWGAGVAFVPIRDEVQARVELQATLDAGVRF